MTADRIAQLERELSKAQRDAQAARDALEHNLGLANKTARHAQQERDDMIRNLRRHYSAIEIAEMVGLSRQRIHQILNEDVTPSPQPGADSCNPAYSRCNPPDPADSPSDA